MKKHMTRYIMVLGASLAAVLTGCGKNEAGPASEGNPVVVAASSSAVQPEVKTPASAAKVVKLASALAQAQKTAPEDKAQPPNGGIFPDDKGGQLLLELLRPGAGQARGTVSGPKKLSGPASIERPAVTAPPYQGLPARFPLKPADQPQRPRELPEQNPLLRKSEEPKLPQPILFSLQALERWPAPDSGGAGPLPLMALYQLDRASLTGPSAESSREAALAAAMPPRDMPVPFARFNLPDPFENRQVIRTTAVDEESSSPVVATPRPLVK